MKKLVILALAIVLTASLCVSCVEQPHVLEGSFYGEIGDPVFKYEFMGSRVWLYTNYYTVAKQGDWTLSKNTIHFRWDDTTSDSHSFRWVDGQKAFILDGDRWFN